MRSALSVLVALALTLPASGQSQEEIPLLTWQAPPFWSPSSPPMEPSAPEGRLLAESSRTALASFSPVPFVAMTPCRQYDSRLTSPLLNATPYTVGIVGAPCLIPVDAQAVSVNITIFSIVGATTPNGVFQVSTDSTTLRSWINYPTTETQRSNAGTMPLSGAGAIVVNVKQGGGSVHFTVDVNGYYAPLGLVNRVDATLPVVSSGGATPTISIDKANTSTDGYLSAVDWTLFNNKGAGNVTSVSGSGGTTGMTFAGGPITGAGTLTLGGTLEVASGGTGAGTAAGALNNLLPGQTGNSGNVLTTDGSNPSWAAAGETTWYHEFWGSVALVGVNSNIEAPIASGVPNGTKVVVIVDIHASNDTFDSWGCQATLGSFSSPDRRDARHPTMGQSMVFSGTTSASSSSFVLSCRNNNITTAIITSYTVRIVKAAAATSF